MLQRAWLNLDRKLVDKTDMEFTVDGMEGQLDEVSAAMWGPGILVTTQYPSPFPLTLSSSTMNVTVGYGIGFDTIGKFTSINPNTTNSPTIAPAVGDSSHARWDLLVIEYAQVGDTPVPKPSDPLTTVDLNYHDDFVLRVIAGTPSASPVYPSYSGPGFILMGLQVPVNAIHASQIVLDATVAQYSRFGIAQEPVFVREALTPIADGTTTVFTISQTPITPGSLAVMKDGAKVGIGKYTLVGKTITFFTAPAIGEELWGTYVAASPNSQNPVQAKTDAPTDPVDGTNRQFTLTMTPIYQQATDVFIDGEWIPPNQWALVSETGAPSYILFNAGKQPVPGQSVEVQYWFNSWPVLSVSLDTPNITDVIAGPGCVVTTPSPGVRQVSAPSASGGFSIEGSEGSPVSLGTGTFTPTVAQRLMVFINSTGGAVTVTGSPQIAAGSVIGQELVLIGMSSINYPIFSDGTGLSLNGSCSLVSGQVLSLFWTGSVWREQYRVI